MVREDLLIMLHPTAKGLFPSCTIGTVMPVVSRFCGYYGARGNQALRPFAARHDAAVFRDVLSGRISAPAGDEFARRDRGGPRIVGRMVSGIRRRAGRDARRGGA